MVWLVLLLVVVVARRVWIFLRHLRVVRAQPQFLQQLAVRVRIRVARHQQLLAVENGIGPRQKTQRLHGFAHLAPPR